MDLLKDVYSECFSPVKIKIWNGIKQNYEESYVPCGKCYHCRITKVNEWTTRMLLQSLESAHTYFCTLTYDSNSCPQSLLEECDCVTHKYNYNHENQIAPLVLNRKHLQKFFKRLRKNTGKNCQYFACGEYGFKYSRPHYHFILWSDDVFTRCEIENAWCLYNEKIGNVDFQDMNVEALNIEHSFKYVCKYLQKGEFSLDKLKTCKYHYENCRKNYYGILPDFKTNNFEEALYLYTKKYSPFFLCSKKPAIGFEYFERNKDRFTRQDFRIFELSEDCIFPSYFFRKTKECLCPFKTISSENGKPNSYSHIPDVAAFLVELQNCIEFNEGFCCHNATYEYLTNFERGEYSVRFISERGGDVVLPQKYFCFYDCKNKFTYSLAPDFMYNVVNSKKELIYRVPISTLLDELRGSYFKLVNDFLLPIFYKNEALKEDKRNKVLSEFSSYDDYVKCKSEVVSNLIGVIKERQKQYELKKVLF